MAADPLAKAVAGMSDVEGALKKLRKACTIVPPSGGSGIQLAGVGGGDAGGKVPVDIGKALDHLKQALKSRAQKQPRTTDTPDARFSSLRDLRFSGLRATRFSEPPRAEGHAPSISTPSRPFFLLNLTMAPVQPLS